MQPVDEIVGRNVRERRLLAGMTQEDLAQAIGVSFQQVQKYERGTNRISAGRIVTLSQALGVSIMALFAGTIPGEQRAVDEVAIEHTRRTMALVKQFTLLPDDVQATFSAMLYSVGRQLGHAQETGV